MLDSSLKYKRSDPFFVDSINKIKTDPRFMRHFLIPFVIGIGLDFAPLFLLLPYVFLLLAGRISLNILSLSLLVSLVLISIYFLYLVFISVKEFKVSVTPLNLGKGKLKVIYFSDLHVGIETFGAKEKKIRKLVEKINEVNPDMVFWGGDLLTEYLDESAIEALKILNEIKCEHKYGVLGNHDSYYLDNGGYMEMPREFIHIFKQYSNFKLLINEKVKVNVNGVTVNVGGVADLSSKLTDLNKIEPLKDNDSELSILLSHNPDITDLIVEEDKIDLILSGHNHAAQVLLPVLGPVLPMPSHHKEYLKGIFHVGETVLFVSQGIGVSGTRLRIGTNCELNVLEIS
jgi:predicted MPP superfamily phosphohydrolase